MSGHSHFSTIKRQKEAKDQARGKIFSKMGRAITIAVKTGGGPDPESNYKLRMAVDLARAANMPKDNIERAISKGQGAGKSMEEVVYEGFGPEGIGVIAEVTTDNRNRTAQEMKNLFERSGGNLGGPGSVSFNFQKYGFLFIEKSENTEEQMLKLIDLGIEDMEETSDGIEIYLSPDKLREVRKKLDEAQVPVRSVELIMKPTTLQSVSSGSAAKVLAFLEKLDEHEDVQNVFTNADIPEEALTQQNAS